MPEEFLFYICLVLCFSSFLTVAFVFRCFGQTSSATVVVSPPSLAVSIGQNFTVGIDVSNVSDLYGWEFKLGWNASLLDLVSVDEGPFLKSGGGSFFTYYVNATDEHVVVDCSLEGDIPGVSGNGTLATVTFYVKSVGECPLQLYDVILLDSSEMQIDCNTVSGYGYFTPRHDIAVTGVSASPRTVVIEDNVNITVTVQNQGDFAEVFNVTACANSQIIGVQPVSLNDGFPAAITFIWNTSGFREGDYEVSASASVVPGEVNTANNIMIADSNVTILYPGHDVAVISVKPSKTAVGQGFCASVATTVKDYGIFNETFYTAAYANTTAIETQIISTLASGNSTTIIFTWNTTGFAIGNYTISGYAEPVQGETDTADNTCTGGTIYVGIPGDVQPEFGFVDMKDVRFIAKRFGADPNSPRWDPNADINNDGFIDMRDIRIAAKNFGKTYR